MPDNLAQEPADILKSPASAPQRSSAPPSGGVNYYPPGFTPPGHTGTSTPVVTPPRAPVPSSQPPSPSKPVPSPPPPDLRDERHAPIDVSALLPPGAGEIAPASGFPNRPVPVTSPSEPVDVSSLLPPGAASIGTSATVAAVRMTPVEAEAKRKSTVDELLPPGVSPSKSTEGSAAIGTLDVGDPEYKPPEGTVILPSAEGGFMQVREAVKTVAFGGEEVELRKLTPEEKARRRAFRTMILLAFGLAVLTLIAYVLMLIG